MPHLNSAKDDAKVTPSEILYQLIAIPSVNPMGSANSQHCHFESKLSDWLIDFFRSIGAPCERIEVAPGRDNIIARYDAPDSNDTVLLDAHQDTVPVEGMTIPAFEPQTRDGRIYGRGSADVKGGMAAMLHAFARLCRERPSSSANVVMSCSCDEEATALGVRALVTYWQTGCDKSRLLQQAPRVAVIAEPTELDVVIAHRGVLRFRVITQGRACHSSDPTQGKNAIYRMADVLRQFEQQAAQLAVGAIRHPLCGCPSLSVGRITGGIAVNIVPDECCIEVDRRLIPGEDPDVVWKQIQTRLANLGDDVCCESPWLRAPALGDANNGKLAQALLASIERVAGPHRHLGVPYCTNASTIGAAGIPAVVFGPGCIAQAHTCDEWIEVEQLESAAEIYFHFCTTIQGNLR